MPVITHKFHLSMNGFSDTRDITPRVQAFLARSGVTNGIVAVSTPGSTAGVTTIEYEPGVVQDLKDAIERIAPQEIEYRHNERWGDGNGFSHVRAALLGPSVSLPVIDGQAALGTWQQIVLIDFDNRSREREVIVQLVGE